MAQFLSGALMMCFASIGFFFFRFWSKSRDVVFALLCIAFILLAFERFLLLGVPPQAEARSYVYLVRLAAFTLIIVGIVQKNRKSS